MHRPQWMIWMMGLLATVTLAPRAHACGGTFRPNCFQTIWLAKFSPGTLVYPGPGVDIDVPIGLLPYVLWNTTSTGPFACAQPVAASLTLTLSCAPAGGGAATTIGPLSVPVAVPAIPGAQVAPISGGPFYTFTIPAGTLPASGVPYVCTVAGTYSVTFGAGTGSGTITGVGDTEVCIVDPAPGDPTLPRLGMSRLQLGGAAYHTCRRGDQVDSYYLIENNDPDNSVTLTFTSRTRQVARMPETNNTTDQTLFAISDPGTNTDNFPQGFTDELPEGGLIPQPNPLEDSDRLIMRELTLAPSGVAIIGVATRSFGMCANGSCSEGLAKVTGTFEDGTTALGCASTALLVEDIAPKSPLCEVTDTIKAAPTVDARWSAATFDQVSEHTTHFYGNLPLDQGGPATVTAGEELDAPWASQVSDILRLDSAPETLTYELNAFPMELDFAQTTANVFITGLGPETSVVVPLIHTGAGSNLSIAVFADSGIVVVTDNNNNGVELFNGDLSALLEAPPGGLFVDPDTSRTFTVDCSDQSAPVLGTDPPFFAQVFEPGSDPEDLLVSVLDQRNEAPLPWTAVSDVASVGLVESAGPGGELLQLDFDVAAMPESPVTAVAMVSIVNGDALNSPLVMPVAVRQPEQEGSAPGNGNDNSTGNQNDNAGNANDNAGGNGNDNTSGNTNDNAGGDGNDNGGGAIGDCGQGSCGMTAGTALSLLLMLTAMRWQHGAAARGRSRR